MKRGKLFWSPRVLAIAHITFLSLFALDVFAMDASFGEKMVGFFMHMIPSFILIAVLAISWSYPLQGSILYTVVSVVSIFFFHTYEHLYAFLIVTMPLLVIGVLFCTSYKAGNGHLS